MFEAAFGVIGGVFKWQSANKQKRLDRQTADLQYDDNLERIRRRGKAQEQTLGKAKAFSQASGVLHSGGSSAQGAIDTMSSEFKKELDWMTAYNKKSRDLNYFGAKIKYQAGNIEAISMFAGGIAKGVASA